MLKNACATELSNADNHRDYMKEVKNIPWKGKYLSINPLKKLKKLNWTYQRKIASEHNHELPFT